MSAQSSNSTPCSRIARLLPAILAFCVITEACVIIYLLATRTPCISATAEGAISTAVAPATADARIAMLEAENARLKQALASRPSHKMGSPVDTSNVPSKITDALAAASADTTQSKWQHLVALQKSTGANARVFVTERPFDASSNKLSPAFISLFEITPAEQTALENAITAARDQLNDLTLKNAVGQMLPDGSFEIKVTAFPESGGATYDQIHNQFRTTLGDDRYAAMQSTSDRELDMMFSSFGAENRTINVSRDTSSDSISIKDLGENDDMKRMKTSTMSDVNEASQQLGNLSTLLPAGFGK